LAGSLFFGAAHVGRRTPPMLVAGPTGHYKLQLNELLIPDTVRQDLIATSGPLLRNSGARSGNYLLVSDQQRRRANY